jgi:hypothetical protein
LRCVAGAYCRSSAGSDMTTLYVSRHARATSGSPWTAAASRG